MTNLDSVLKSRDIALLTKVHSFGTRLAGGGCLWGKREEHLACLIQIV